MSSQPTLALERVLRVLKPLVRLLLANGVTYPVLAAALKPVFLEAAQDELTRKGGKATDSALSLLSGVHRRDVRTLKSEPLPAAGAPPALGTAAQVVGRWMHDPDFCAADGSPRRLARGRPDDGSSFDALVARVSSDVRPRAVLDELLRLGVAQEGDEGIALVNRSFTPRAGFAEQSWLLAANLHDHAAAAVANLEAKPAHGEAGAFLEQALFVDRLTPESAHELHRAAAAAWREAYRRLMPQAQARFDADAAEGSARANRRVRFGVYFFSEADHGSPTGSGPAPGPSTESGRGQRAPAEPPR